MWVQETVVAYSLIMEETEQNTTELSTTSWLEIAALEIAEYQNAKFSCYKYGWAQTDLQTVVHVTIAAQLTCVL